MSHSEPASVALSPKLVEEIFPFLLAMDSELRIIRFGRALAKVCHNLALGALLTDVFAIARPRVLGGINKESLRRAAERRRPPLAAEEARAAFVDLHAGFVRIHPFADGNGRMARLLANVPVLEAGYPPLIIPREQRSAYISALAEWQTQVGKPRPQQALLPHRAVLTPLDDLCQTAWQSSLDLVAEFQQRQSKRPHAVVRHLPAPGL